MGNVYVSFNGGGNTEFTPEQRSLIEQSVDAMAAATGLLFDQTRSAPLCVEFDLKTVTQLVVHEIGYRKIGEDKVRLFTNAKSLDILVVNPNREKFGMI